MILKNGYVDTVTAIGDLDGLTFENITFRGVSNTVNLDTNASALYLQGTTKMTNVLVDGCEFVGPASDETTIAITTLNVDGLTVKDSAVDGYTISAYHNPGNGGNITYQNNNFKNIQSGIGFIATDGITVTAIPLRMPTASVWSPAGAMPATPAPRLPFPKISSCLLRKMAMLSVCRTALVLPAWLMM